MPVDHSDLHQRIRVSRRAAEAGGSYVLDVANPTDYASAVASIDGVDVFDPPHQAEVAAENVAAVADSHVTSDRVVRALDKAGHEEVAHLRSLTEATTDDGRRKHPTGFADVTGQLAGAYEHDARKLSGPAA